MSNTITTGRTYARAGLLGNPSDGFGGRVLSIAIADFSAEVDAEPADRWEIVDSAWAAFDDVAAVRAKLPELEGATQLIGAALVTAPSSVMRGAGMIFLDQVPDAQEMKLRRVGHHAGVQHLDPLRVDARRDAPGEGLRIRDASEMEFVADVRSGT